MVKVDEPEQNGDACWEFKHTVEMQENSNREGWGGIYIHPFMCFSRCFKYIRRLEAVCVCVCVCACECVCVRE